MFDNKKPFLLLCVYHVSSDVFVDIQITLPRVVFDSFQVTVPECSREDAPSSFGSSEHCRSFR